MMELGPLVTEAEIREIAERVAAVSSESETNYETRENERQFQRFVWVEHANKDDVDGAYHNIAVLTVDHTGWCKVTGVGGYICDFDATHIQEDNEEYYCSIRHIIPISRSLED
jgi:hypothetical protein